MAAESVVRGRAATIFGEAAVMLLVGFYMFEPSLSGTELSDYAAVATVWTFRAGGVALLALAGFCLSGRREALLANAGIDLAIGLVFAVSGVILLMAGSRVEAMLVALFGLMSLGSARWNWNTWRSVSAAAAGQEIYRAARGPEMMETAVEHVDVDRAAGRADALKRLFESKRAEATSREDAAPSTDDKQSRAEATCCRQDRGSLLPSTPTSRLGPGDADKSARSSPPPATRVEPRPDEPPPDGFLADLGRDPEGR